MTRRAAITAANSSKVLIRMPLLTAHTTPAAAAIVLTTPSAMNQP